MSCSYFFTNTHARAHTSAAMTCSNPSTALVYIRFLTWPHHFLQEERVMGSRPADSKMRTCDVKALFGPDVITPVTTDIRLEVDGVMREEVVRNVQIKSYTESKKPNKRRWVGVPRTHSASQPAGCLGCTSIQRCAVLEVCRTLCYGWKITGARLHGFAGSPHSMLLSVSTHNP